MSDDNYIGRMPYTSDKWRKCGVWMRMSDGTAKFAECDVIGAVALWPVTVDLGKQYTAWRLAHIPTGRWIIQRWRLDDARAVAEALASVARELNTTSAGKARKVVAEVIGD